MTNRLAVSRLDLGDFRCYARLRLDIDAGPVVLTGPNGAGKTNLLEAISLLAPGSGLRRAKLGEIARNVPATDDGSVRAWAVSAQLETPDGQYQVGSGLDPQALRQGRERRAVKIDGEAQRGQASLGRVCAAVWLTPQMDRLFLDGPSARRRFLDRLVYGLDPDHSGRVAAFEHGLRSRAKLLKAGKADDKWLNAIEDSMVRHGIAVVVARAELLDRLVRAGTMAIGAFPAARLALAGDLENWLEQFPAVEVEDRMRAALRDGRERDAMYGGAAVGPQRSDLMVWHEAKNQPAAQCSTGEQKALLLSIVMANTRLQSRARGAGPLLLLDEVVAHLDAERRGDLFDEIVALGVQAWMTGTDRALFDGLIGRAQFFRVEDASVSPETI
ncbi:MULTISPECIES: DNA replication/repair protein RecF [unclassified Thalassospira]|uniref:DNA replication/repair protein RecF n=1 Tax=unclassified Thalassospira TaxID=2648997 RepID=UPI000A1E81AB|nr:DNA replication/repair protein RecF [Thalassospira sp. MCCC 1A01428]OSQ45955.1 recombinase RecF [Thalassospira sp. MCCC 1A01428]